MANHKYLYRAIATYEETGALVHFQRFIVVGETPCFYKVIPDFMDYMLAMAKELPDSTLAQKQLKENTKRVGKASQRRYCHESIKDAIRSLYRRRRRHLVMATVECGVSRAIIAAIEPMLSDDRLMPSEPKDIDCGMFHEMELVRFD